MGGSGYLLEHPNDTFGIAYFRTELSSTLEDQLAPVLALKGEGGVEMLCNVAVTRWFRITGNVQFIKPALGANPEATHVGIGTYVKF